MRPEPSNTSEPSFSTPNEFANLLKYADAALRPIIVIGGLAKEAGRSGAVFSAFRQMA